MKKKITVIGHYAKNKQLFDGQTVKTRILYDEMEASELYDVDLIDTHGWKKKPFSLIAQCYQACKSSDYILMLPDYNGFRVMSILLPFFRGRNGAKIVYVVVGGWVSAFLKHHDLYLKQTNKLNAIIVETQSLKTELEDMGIQNLHIVPNFKRLDIIQEVVPSEAPPYRFCTFSRVMKEKGIEDAIESISRINAKYGADFASLDIYGQIDTGYKEAFEKIMETVPDYIQYKGIVAFDKSVDTLKDYYAMLFPTTYHAECLAGTVIDAFASGLPVIAYEWKSGADLITNGVEGWLCEPSVDKLTELIERAVKKPEEIAKMKINSVNKADTYTPDANIKKITGILESL